MKAGDRDAKPLVDELATACNQAIIYLEWQRTFPNARFDPDRQVVLTELRRAWNRYKKEKADAEV